MTGSSTVLTTAAPPKLAGANSHPRKAAAAPEPNTGLAALTYLRLHWLFILFCGALIGAPAAYAAWSLLPGKYGSYALLMIESNPMSVAGADPGRSGVTAFDTYVKTQRSLIRSQWVLNAALDDPAYGISRLPTLANQRDPVKYLEEKLEVEPLGGEVLRVSLEGDRPEDVKKIIAAVTAAYLRECVEGEIKRQAAKKVKLDGWKVELDKLLTQRLGPTAAPSTLPSGIPDPNIVRAGGTVPIAAIRAAAESPALKQVAFADARDRFSRYRREKEELPARLAKLKSEDDDLATRIDAVLKATIPPETQALLDNDPEVKGKRALADELHKLHQHHRRIHPDGDRSPSVQEKKARAVEATIEADKLAKDKHDFLIGRARRAEIGGLTERRKQVRQSFDEAVRRDKELPGLIDTAQRELVESVPPDVVQAAAAVKGPAVDPQLTDLTTLNGLYAAIALQAERLSFELKSPPRVWEAQPASNPSLKDGKKQLMATIAAGMMGFALVGVGVVAVETRAKKVCSLTDIQAGSQAPVVGVIPAIPRTDDAVGRAAAAEAMDKLRSRVTQAYLGRGATTIAVTSPLGDEGKAITAYGLANSLALAGFKTLLMDFDLRTPALHQHAGVPNSEGVCELLLGKVDYRRSMIVLGNGLHFIPAGMFSEEARAAAVGDRLARMVSALGTPFDCVILHGHALLAAAEAVEVTRRADAVLLCGFYRDTRLPLLKRAIDRLAVMEVPHVGIVYLGATTHEALC